MTRTTGAALVAGTAAIALLAGCLQGGDGTNDTQARGAQHAVSGASGRGGDTDAERPEVFDTSDRALWDGRPSLGGVWVAHPDVTDPERVIIRNPGTGREVVGALFRRERHNPGPAFQVSADAAAALQMLAGAPTDIRVTALRTVETGAPPADATDPQPDPEAATSIADAGGGDEGQTGAETVASAPPVASQVPAASAAPGSAGGSQRQPGLLGRLFGGGRTGGTPEQTQLEADAIAQAALHDSDSAPVQFPDETGGTTGETAGAAPAPSRPAAAPAAPSAPAAPAAAPSSLAQPYIQLGIFSVEDNARRAGRLAEAEGLSAQVTAGQSQGNAFWRVTVGPATDQPARDRLLAQVRALGFNDAYAVRR